MMFLERHHLPETGSRFSMNSMAWRLDGFCEMVAQDPRLPRESGPPAL